jgi:hypothetical protein
MARRKLGSSFDLTERQYVYLQPDCLEIDVVDGYEISRKRVFLTDVCLITMHRQRRWVPLLILGSLSGILLLSGLGAMSAAGAHGDRTPVLIVFAVLGGLPGIMTLWMLLSPATNVTVMGRRTKAVLRFPFRRGRAEAMRDELSALVRQAQAR